MATYCNFTDYTYLQDLSEAHKANTSVMLRTFVVVIGYLKCHNFGG